MQQTVPVKGVGASPARGTHPSWLVQQACASHCGRSAPSPQLQAREFPVHGEKGRRRAFNETGP